MLADAFKPATKRKAKPAGSLEHRMSELEYRIARVETLVWILVGLVGGKTFLGV